MRGTKTGCLSITVMTAGDAGPVWGDEGHKIRLPSVAVMTAGDAGPVWGDEGE